MLKSSLAVIAGLLLFAAAHANDAVVDKPLVAQTLDGFHHDAAAIRDGMKPGGRYEFLKESDRYRVDTNLDKMEALLQKHAGENDLGTHDKIALANAQEEVNAILRHNDSNRLVCESRAPVGSHLPVKTCRTFGEIELRRKSAQRTMTDLSATRQKVSGN